MTFGLGCWLSASKRKWVLTISLLVLAAALVFFKVYKAGTMLPVGMSFYLFQMAAYLVDCFRGTYKADRNLLSYGSKMVMFPKLLSGPIIVASELESQQGYVYSSGMIRAGFQKLIVGLALKVLLASRLGSVMPQTVVMGFESISVPYAWLALICFALQLYFDFFGYSLMAVGLGQMFGFFLPDNFNHPYASKSVSEFYRRWHMTLGLWFRKYIYIPLGGNRKGAFLTLLNLAVVWLLTGLWHGVGGNYLIWAGILLFFIINERLWLRKLLDKCGFLAHIYTLFAILISWIPFAIGDFDSMLIFAGRLFGTAGQTVSPLDFTYDLKAMGHALVVGILLAMPWPEKLWLRIRKSWVADVIIFVIFWFVVHEICTAEQSPFLYFQY